MSLNPNAPVFATDWAPAYGANGGVVPLKSWVEITPRTRSSVSIKRGKQYELDQIQASELSVVLDNTDGLLDPLNSAGPWFGNIRPFQPWKELAQWSPTVNLLPAAIASGGEGYTTGAIPASFGITSATDSTGGIIANPTNGQQGSNCLEFNVVGEAGAATICVLDAGGIVPGQQYTFSLYVQNASPTTSVTVAAQFGWYGTQAAASSGTPTSYSLSSPATLAGSSSSNWQRITVTGTAPAAVYGARIGLALTSSGYSGAIINLQIDSLQLEKAATASAWTMPGTLTSLFSGFVERWTPQYVDAGTRAQAQVTAVDAFALFSQRTLNDALTEEINAYNPRFLYRLNDPQGSASAADATGNNPSVSVIGARNGSAPFAFGTQHDQTATGFYGNDTVLTLTNPTGNSTTFKNASLLSLSGAGIKGPANPALWTRIIAFRTSGALGGGNVAQLWGSYDNTVYYGGSVPTQNGSNIQVNITDTGAQFFAGIDTSLDSMGGNFGGTTTPTDGNWHLAVFGLDTAGGQYLASLDGNTASAFGSTGGKAAPTGIVNDFVGASVIANMGNLASEPFPGDIALVAEVPVLLTSAQITSLYTAWRNAATGESTDARYARILRYLGFTGSTQLDSGNTRSMGPCDFGGSDGLSALQAVVDTETGAHWIRGDGSIRFRSRSARYNQLTPTLTFGENAAGGEIPYTDIQLDYDSTHLANVVQITQTSTSQVFTAQDLTSQSRYFERLLTRSVNTTNALECQDCASYLVSRYKDPKMRVSGIKIDPSANPSVWTALLALDLGARVRVMRRPLGAPPIQLDCFVEQIQWDIADTGEALLSMQLSPADTTPYAIFAAWRTTLNLAASSGATSITVNAPTFDNQTPLAAQVGVGQQIVVGTGGGVPETMTVKAVSATSPGWSTGVITFTSALAHSHTAGFNVTEVLPTNTTPSNTWDLAAVANSVNFAY